MVFRWLVLRLTCRNKILSTHVKQMWNKWVCACIAHFRNLIHVTNKTDKTDEWSESATVGAWKWLGGSFGFPSTAMRPDKSFKWETIRRRSVRETGARGGYRGKLLVTGQFRTAPCRLHTRLRVRQTERDAHRRRRDYSNRTPHSVKINAPRC